MPRLVIFTDATDEFRVDETGIRWRNPDAEPEGRLLVTLDQAHEFVIWLTDEVGRVQAEAEENAND